jgi:Domain of unknown function (DUF4917)
MPDVLSFDEAIKASGSRIRTLLLGNGFSIAQGGGQFGYKTLLEKSGLAENDPIRNVFRILDTFDFEKVMKALEDAAIIESAYGEENRSKKFFDDAARVRDGLVHAVHAVHPGNKFDIPKSQRDACALFLKHFDSIFTLSYDLLLYWVIIHAATDKFSDGFGLGNQIDGFREYVYGANCNTYYLHGALHLFLGPHRETRKRIVTNNTIVNDITDTIRRLKQLPLFVAEGSSGQKLARINSVPYLSDCYKTLQCLDGSVFIFGHSAGEEDRHIYEAIFGGEISKVFFCVHRPEDDWSETRGRLTALNEINRNIEIAYVDASTANAWGTPE